MLNGDKEVIMNRNLGIPEACKISGISRAMLYKLIKAGEGPPITKIGGDPLSLQIHLIAG